jgi:hypothetical protein
MSKSFLPSNIFNLISENGILKKSMCFGASLENNLKKNPTRVLTI